MDKINKDNFIYFKLIILIQFFPMRIHRVKGIKTIKVELIE